MNPSPPALSERHQRFYSPGWARFAAGKQPDLVDRYVAALDGTLTTDPALALVVDAVADPSAYATLAERYEREFFSTAFRRWV